MFVAVVAALYILTAATGGSAADSCAISLPPLVLGVVIRYARVVVLQSYLFEDEVH